MLIPSPLMRKISPLPQSREIDFMCSKLAQPTDNILYSSFSKCRNSLYSLGQIWCLHCLFCFISKPEYLFTVIFCIVYNSPYFQNVNLNLFICMFDLIILALPFIQNIYFNLYFIYIC